VLWNSSSFKTVTKGCVVLIVCLYTVRFISFTSPSKCRLVHGLACLVTTCPLYVYGTVTVNWRFSYVIEWNWLCCRVLVGAPRDNVSLGSSMNVERPGAVYSCPLTSLHNDCTQLAIDHEGSHCIWDVVPEIHVEECRDPDVVSCSISSTLTILVVHVDNTSYKFLTNWKRADMFDCERLQEHVFDSFTSMWSSVASVTHVSMTRSFTYANSHIRP